MSTALRLTLQRTIGFIAALSLAAAFLFNAVPASAQPLGADELLPSSFTDTTGLGNANLETTIGALIKTVIRFLGIVAVIVVLYGGFKWMTASGNDEKVADAKRILIAGLIGLAIVLTSLAITNFVISQILTAAQSSVPAGT